MSTGHATQWIESVDRTQFHDPAVAAYARAIVKRTPREAVSSCEEVIEQGPQEACFVSVARSWLQRQPKRASAWLAQSSLDEETRVSIREWVAAKQRLRSTGGADPGTSDEG